METRVLTAHAPKQLVDKVDQIAERLERSRAWVIKQALTDWIAREEEKRQMTLEAMQDVRSGDVMSHEDMKQWADTLK